MKLSYTTTSKDAYSPPVKSTIVLNVGSNWLARGVLHGPNKPGYPKWLGKRNLTTSLSGQETLKFTPNSGQGSAEIDNPSKDKFELSGVHLPVGRTIECTMFSDPEVASFEQQLNTKLFSNVYSDQSTFAGGVFIGEISQALRIIPGAASVLGRRFLTLSQLYKQIQEDAKGVSRRRRKAYIVRRFSEAWLTFTFGVVPLINDIEQAGERVNQILEQRKIKRVKARLDFNLVDSSTHQNTVGLLKWETQCLESTTWRGKGFANITVLPSGSQFNLQNFGVGLNDFVPTLYELIPFSFVVDYFSNLNEWVNSHFAAVSTLTIMCCGSEQVAEFQATSSSMGFNGNTVYPTRASGGAGPCLLQMRKVRRWNPDFQGATFVWGHGPSSKQIVNLAALTAALSKIRF